MPARQSHRGHHLKFAVLGWDEDRAFAEGDGAVPCAVCTEAVTGVEPATVDLTSEDIWNASQVQCCQQRDCGLRVTPISARCAERLLCQRGLDSPILPPYLVDARGQVGIVGVFLTKATQHPEGLVKIPGSRQRFRLSDSFGQPHL